MLPSPNFTVCETALKEVKGRGKCAMEGKSPGHTKGRKKKDAQKSHEAFSLVDSLFFFFATHKSSVQSPHSAQI